MSWYDYVPAVGSITRLAQGDYKGALNDQLSAGSPTGALINQHVAPWVYDKGKQFTDKIKNAADEQRQGYEDANHQLQQLAWEQRQYQEQGLNKAEGYYDPVNQRIDDIYGPPGTFRK